MRSLGLSDERQLLWLLALVISPDVESRQVAQMTVRLLVNATNLVGHGLLGGEALEDALVRLLFVEGRVLVNLVILVVARDLANSLGLAESMIEHALIVAEQGHLASEARVPMVLRPREAIVTLFHGGRVRLSSASIVVNLGVIA